MKQAMKLIALVLCLAFALTACSGGDTNTGSNASTSNTSTAGDGQTSASDSSAVAAVTKDDPETLNYACGSEPGLLDPQGNTNIHGMCIGRQVYDTLITKNAETGEFEPCLATEWEWLDDTHLSMTLREGVKFQDGTDFTADDVLFTIGRFEGGAATGSLYSAFDAANSEVVDDTHITIAFKNSFAPAMNFLTNPRAFIVSKDYVEANGAESLNQNACGTGPFQFKEWVIGSHIDLERFDGYWGEAPALKNIRFQIIVDETARMVALETGAVDIASEINDSDTTRMLNGEVKNVTGYAVPSYKVWFLAFNEEFEPFQDSRVRLAFAHAVDWVAACESAGGSLCQPAQSCLAQTIFAYQPQGIYEYDPELAKQLLADAGYPDGFEVTATEEEYPLAVRFLEIIQAYVAEVGITMNIEVVDAPTWNEGNSNGTNMMTVGNMTANTGDPSHTLNQMAADSPNRTINWQDEEFNRLYNEGMTETDEAARQAIYEELQKYVYDTALQIPMWEQVITYGVQNYVQNFVPDAGIQFDLRHVSIA